MLKTKSVGIQSVLILVAAGEDIVWMKKKELVFEAHYSKVLLTKFVCEEKRKKATYLFGLNFLKKLWDDKFRHCVNQFAGKCNIIDDTHTIYSLQMHVHVNCIHDCTRDYAEFVQ